MRWMSTLVVGLLLAASPAQGQSLPGPPTNVAAAITNDVLDVTWTAPTTGDPVVAYFVMITGAGLPGGAAVPAFTTSLSLPVSGLAFGIYTITVVGVNGAGQGPASAPVDVAYGASAVPSVPLNLTASYVNDVLTIRWDPPVTGTPIASYRLFFSGAGLGPGGVVSLPDTSITVPVSGLLGAYVFSVSAVNALGVGPMTPPLTLQIGPSAVPSVPRNLAVAHTNGVLTVSWDPPVSGDPILSYVLVVAGPGVNAGISISGTSVSVPSAGLLGAFTFQVAAVNAVGVGPASPTVTLQIGPAAVPSVPLNLVAGVANGLLTISWLPPVSGAPIDYYRLYATVPGTPGAVVRVDDTTISVPIAGLTEGTYTFAATAVNSVGESPMTVPVAVTIGPTGPPSAPKNVVATVTNGVLLVSWDPPDSGPPNSYVLRATGTSFNGVWTLRLGSTAFSSNATQLTPGVYTFTVSGENSRGEGPASAPATVTVGPPCIAPAAPVLSGSASGGIASLSWTTPSGAVTGYTLQVTLAATGGVFTADLGLLTSIAGPLAPGSYTFGVTARSSCGASPPSNGLTLNVP